MPLISPETKRKGLKISLAFIFAGIGVLVYLTMAPHPPPVESQGTRFWYYNTGDRSFVQQTDLLPPVAKSGNSLYRAYVFGCGNCEDPSKTFVGWLEKFTNEAKEKLKADHGIIMYTGPKGLESITHDDLKEILPKDSVLIRSLAKDEWIDAFSQEASELSRQALSRCNDDAVSCDLSNNQPLQ